MGFQGAPNGFFISQANADAVAAAGTGEFDAMSAIYGVQIGGNVDMAPLVLGAVADFSAFHIEGDLLTSTVFPTIPGNPFTVYTEAKADWLATFRGRVGITAGDALLFATGGAAVSQLEVTSTFTEPNFPATHGPGTESGIAIGGAAGIGAEYAISEQLSIGAEYVYVNIPGVTASYQGRQNQRTDDIDTTFGFSAHTVRATLNFHP